MSNGEFCPHCCTYINFSSDVYDAEIICPKCNQGFVPKAVEAERQAAKLTEQDIDEINKGHKCWLFLATVIGIGLSYYIVESIAGGDALPTGIKVFYIIGMAYAYAAGIYGFYRYHPIKRAGLNFLFPLVMIIVFYIAIIGGMFKYYPSALMRLIRRKQLITYPEYMSILKDRTFRIKKIDPIINAIEDDDARHHWRP